MNSKTNYNFLNILGQISEETGISEDYINKFLGIITSYELNGEKGILSCGKIRTYKEMYPENRYLIPITTKNRKEIKRLDDIVEKINNSENPLEKLEFTNKAIKIITGKKEKTNPKREIFHKLLLIRNLLVLYRGEIIDINKFLETINIKIDIFPDRKMKVSDFRELIEREIKKQEKELKK